MLFFQVVIWGPVYRTTLRNSGHSIQWLMQFGHSGKIKDPNIKKFWWTILRLCWSVSMNPGPYFKITIMLVDVMWKLNTPIYSHSFLNAQSTLGEFICVHSFKLRLTWVTILPSISNLFTLEKFSYFHFFLKAIF